MTPMVGNYRIQAEWSLTCLHLEEGKFGQIFGETARRLEPNNRLDTISTPQQQNRNRPKKKLRTFKPPGRP